MKKLFLVIPLVFLLCFAFACQNKAEKAELEKFRAQAKLEEQNKEIIIRFCDGLNKGSVQIMDELYAPEHRWYYSSKTPKPMIREETIEFFAAFLKAFPDANWTISLRGQGDSLADRQRNPQRRISRHSGDRESG